MDDEAERAPWYPDKRQPSDRNALGVMPEDVLRAAIKLYGQDKRMPFRESVVRQGCTADE